MNAKKVKAIKMALKERLLLIAMHCVNGITYNHVALRNCPVANKEFFSKYKALKDELKDPPQHMIDVLNIQELEYNDAVNEKDEE